MRSANVEVTSSCSRVACKMLIAHGLIFRSNHYINESFIVCLVFLVLVTKNGSGRRKSLSSNVVSMSDITSCIETNTPLPFYKFAS